MANKYPSSVIVLEPLIPSVRSALIARCDKLREEIRSDVDLNHFDAAVSDTCELKRIHDFLKTLDSLIQFDDSDDIDFSELD